MRATPDGFFLGEYKILELLAKGRMSGSTSGPRDRARSSPSRSCRLQVPPTLRNPGQLFPPRRQLLTRLDHPNVVRALSVGEADGRHYHLLLNTPPPRRRHASARCWRAQGPPARPSGRGRRISAASRAHPQIARPLHDPPRLEPSSNDAGLRRGRRRPTREDSWTSVARRCSTRRPSPGR